MEARRWMKKNWKSGILFIVVLSIASLGARAITSHNRQSTAVPIQLDVTSQHANGLTERDFNPQFLRSLQAYITKDLTQKRRELDQVSSQAEYLQGDKKLAGIRVRTPRWNSVAIVGFVGDKLMRVVCTRSSEEMIAITDGSCGDKIHEVFGVSPEIP
jgi:hypothetical protein